MEQQERIIEGYVESRGLPPLSPGMKKAILVAIALGFGGTIAGAEQLAVHWDAIMLWITANWFWLAGAGSLLGLPKGWKGYTSVVNYIDKREERREMLKIRQSERLLQEAAIEQMRGGTPTKFTNALTGITIESGMVFAPVASRVKELPSPTEQKKLALPEGQVRPPTLRECIQAVEENSYNLCLGRDRATGDLIVVPFYKRHLRVIGASQKGKSTAAAAIMKILTATHSPELVQLALLDLENQTCHLFEDLPHVATWEGQQLLARTPEEVAEKLHLLVEMLNYRYTLKKSEVQFLPLMVVYLEELITLKDYFKSMIKAVRVYGKAKVDEATSRYAQLMFDIRELARRGLKARIQLLVCAQVDYRDDDLVEAWRNITSGLCFAVKPSAAMAAGFRETELLEVCAKDDKKGQFVAEMNDYKGIGLSPYFDLEKEIIAWEDAHEEDDGIIDFDAPTIPLEQTDFPGLHLVGGRTVGEQWRSDLEPIGRDFSPRPNSPEKVANWQNTGDFSREQDSPENTANPHQEQRGGSPETRQSYPEMEETQVVQFKALYPLLGIEKALDRIEGCNHKHREHARAIIQEFGLQRKRG